MGTLISGLNFSSDSMNPGTLRAVCEMLPSKAKVAFYKAASARRINQGTWDRCAFNAAGVTLGVDGISSVEGAAKLFGASLYVVSQFITVWDGWHSQDPTSDLRIALEDVGIFTEPTDKIRVIDKETEQEFFESLEKNFELSDEDLAACKLLFKDESGVYA